MNGLFISTAVEMLGGIRLGDDSDGSDDSDGGIGDYYWFVVEFAGCILSMLLLVSTIIACTWIYSCYVHSLHECMVHPQLSEPLCSGGC